MNNKFTFTLFFVFVFSLSFIMAQGLGPGVPHHFYGSATYNGATASGLTIDAYIEDIKIDSTTVAANGEYIFLVKDSEGGYEDKTIEFHLNGIDTDQTATFENGASTKLDLSASGPSNGGNGGGGNGGGGSRGSVATTSTSGGGGFEPLSSDANETSEEISVGGGMTGGVIGALGTGGMAVLSVILIIIIIGLIIIVSRKKK